MPWNKIATESVLQIRKKPGGCLPRISSAKNALLPPLPRQHKGLFFHQVVMFCNPFLKLIVLHQKIAYTTTLST